MKKILVLALVLILSLAVIGCDTNSFEYTLDVEVEGGGSVKHPNSSSHMVGTTVTLDAQADEGWKFVEWGGENGNEVTYKDTILMNGNKSIKAIFEDEGPETGDIDLDFVWERSPEALSSFYGVSKSEGIELSWEDEQEDIKGYFIYRSSEEGDSGKTLTDSLIRDKVYLDYDVEEGETYYYSIRAYSGENFLAGRLSQSIEVIN